MTFWDKIFFVYLQILLLSLELQDHCVYNPKLLYAPTDHSIWSGLCRQFFIICLISVLAGFYNLAFISKWRVIQPLFLCEYFSWLRRNAQYLCLTTRQLKVAEIE